MKKSGQICLLVGGILCLFSLLISIGMQPLIFISSGGMSLFVLPIIMVIQVCSLLSGIFSLVAVKRFTKNWMITNIIFAVLGGSIVTLVGAILALVAIGSNPSLEGNEEKQLVVVDENGEEIDVSRMDEDEEDKEEEPQEVKLKKGGKIVKLIGKITLGLGAIAAFIGILLEIVLFGFGCLSIGGSLVYFVFEIIDMIPVFSSGDFEYIMIRLIDPLIFAGAGLVFGIFLLVVSAALILPSLLSFIFSLVGACKRKNTKGIYVTNIVFSVLGINALEMIGAILCLVGVSLKEKPKELPVEKE